METDHHEGTLYGVPVNYGKTNVTVTLPSAMPYTPAEDPRGKHKATWRLGGYFDTFAVALHYLGCVLATITRY